ncbi:AraC family transcriptional regulator [Chryseobacterium sp. SN22]|uniref:helix-turn-helix domain-containing protein n=1 Tax=Chryseobacterium sp. SN22 TaxID=2606431 RepID=UPI0011EDDD48|nr:helix-turn-helix domain-containing protein [Chryseobacterium sp. SN22]KAA0128089.1 AraC family transcriptional regulator [Chryseobacterium sp. SN22]
MSKFFSIIFIAVYALILAGTGNPEKNELFRKAGSEIVMSPERTMEVLDYIEKNFTLDNEESGRLTYLRAKSLYYQNNLTDALKMISKEHEHFSPGLIILRRNILYSFNIKDTFSPEDMRENSDYRFSEKIGQVLSRLAGKGKRAGSSELSAVLKEMKSHHPAIQRENMLNLSEYLARHDPGLQYQDFLNRVITFYQNDPAFKILYAKYLLKNNKAKEAGILIEELPKEILEQSTNVYLKYRYYDLLVTYYSKTGQQRDYKEAVQKKEALFITIDRVAFSAKNKWFGILEENYRNELDSSIITRRYILFSVLGIAVLLVIFLVARLLQIRTRIEEYENFTVKLRLKQDKKTVQPQAIPEKTETLLIQKLQDFEKTNDCISPDISLQSLAKKLDTNTKYLSEIINKHKQKNFNAYINELRINYITCKLKESNVYRNYKIKYLAEESGFSTHSAFAAAFKTVNGISPAHYIQLLNHKEE